MGVNPISPRSPHVRTMGRTCGEAAEIKKNTHPQYIGALFCAAAAGGGRRQHGPRVRVVSRSISPPWGSTRFRVAPRTYAPWGCIVRVANLTKPRKIPTRKILLLFFVGRVDVYFNDKKIPVDTFEQCVPYYAPPCI